LSSFKDKIYAFISKNYINIAHSYYNKNLLFGNQKICELFKLDNFSKKTWMGKHRRREEEGEAEGERVERG